MKRNAKVPEVKYFVLIKDVLLPDYDAQLKGVNRFLGRKAQAPWELNYKSFPLSVPLRSEYHKALKNNIIEEENTDSSLVVLTGTKGPASSRAI